MHVSAQIPCPRPGRRCRGAQPGATVALVQEPFDRRWTFSFCEKVHSKQTIQLSFDLDFQLRFDLPTSFPCMFATYFISGSISSCRPGLCNMNEPHLGQFGTNGWAGGRLSPCWRFQGWELRIWVEFGIFSLSPYYEGEKIKKMCYHLSENSRT